AYTWGLKTLRMQQGLIILYTLNFSGCGMKSKHRFINYLPDKFYLNCNTMNVLKKEIATFEKYLTLWVLLCIGAGIFIGHFAGQIMQRLSQMEIYRVNIPIAILIWLMIYPMMLTIDFSSIRNIGR